MAPVSILPGRVRYDAPEVRGRRDESRELERWLGDAEGILEASVNPRTGRVLVRFDESRTSRELITGLIERLLARLQAGRLICGTPTRQDDKPVSRVAGRMIVDAFAHAFLPGPLGLLVPAVMHPWGRKELLAD